MSKPIYLNGIAMEVMAGGLGGDISPSAPVRLTLSGRTFQPVVMRVQSWSYAVHVPYTAATGWASRQQIIDWAKNTAIAEQVYALIDQFGAAYSVYLASATYPVQVTPEQDGPSAYYVSTLRFTHRI